MTSLSREQITSTVSIAGIVVRYGFYLTGALVLAMIGIAIVMFWGDRIRVTSERPAFQIASSDLARLPVSERVVTGGRYGRVEMVHYGQLHNRDIDLAVNLILPPKSAEIIPEIAPQLPGLRPPGQVRAVLLQTHYDLETRFGPVRAREMRVESDGQWKQCLSYRSRFDTNSVHLTGWYCDASGMKPGIAKLACLLDKLTLKETLDSAEADRFIREQAARPAQCAAYPVSQTTDTRMRSRPSAPSNWSVPSALRR